MFVWDNISLNTLLIDACTIPLILLGGFIGIRLVKIIPEREFRYFTLAVTILSVIMMLVV
jgi:uncharacterized membrane protein YfcA